jgi:hypothetical protein
MQANKAKATKLRASDFYDAFAEDAAGGHTSSPRLIREVIPGTVYVLSGFTGNAHCRSVENRCAAGKALTPL